MHINKSYLFELSDMCKVREKCTLVESLQEVRSLAVSAEG